MKKGLKYIGIAALIYITVFSCNKLISDGLDKQINEDGKEFFEKENATYEIQNSINIINKKTPLDAGGGMKMIKVEFKKEKNKVIYYYENFEKSVDELSELDITSYRDYWRESVLKIINDNPNNSSYVKLNIDFVYKLNDKNGKPILDFTIDNTEYK